MCSIALQNTLYKLGFDYNVATIINHKLKKTLILNALRDKCKYEHEEDEHASTPRHKMSIATNHDHPNGEHTSSQRRTGEQLRSNEARAHEHRI